MSASNEAGQSGARRALRAHLPPLTSFALALTIYVRTLAPTIFGLDSAELTTAAYILGRAHPPGYPLYLLLGKVFVTVWPWGDVGYRMNLMSALFGALAVALVCRLLIKLGCRPLIAVAAALCLAFSFFYWSPSVMAEVYTLNSFLVAVLLLILLAGRDRPGPHWLWALAFVYGLSFGDHVTVALLAPGLAYFVWHTRRGRLFQPAVLGGMTLCFALGLTLYAYLPLRAGVNSWRGFLELASAHSFWGFVFAYSLPELGQQVLAYVRDLWANFLGFGLVLGIIGLASLWRRDRVLATALLGMFLANSLFFIGYQVPDKELMYAHIYLLWAVCLGCGFQWLFDELAPLTRPGSPGRRGLELTFLLSPAILCVVNYPHADLSADWSARDGPARILTTVQANAYVLVNSWAEANALNYLQVVESERPDVLVVSLAAVAPPPEVGSFIGAKIQSHPIYGTELIPLLDRGYAQRWIEACRCYKIEREAPP